MKYNIKANNQIWSLIVDKNPKFWPQLIDNQGENTIVGLSEKEARVVNSDNIVIMLVGILFF